MTRLIQLPDFLNPFKFRVVWYQPPSPEAKFYGLVAVSRPIIDITPRFMFQVSDESGAPQPGVACYHLFGDRYEVFETGGDGIQQFLLGPGSAYNPMDGPTDRFYVGTEYRDRYIEPPAPPLGDIYFYGLPEQHHLDTTFSVRLMSSAVAPPPPPPQPKLDFGEVSKLLRDATQLASQITRLQARLGVLYSDLADAFDKVGK